MCSLVSKMNLKIIESSQWTIAGQRTDPAVRHLPLLCVTDINSTELHFLPCFILLNSIRSRTKQGISCKVAYFCEVCGMQMNYTRY